MAFVNTVRNLLYQDIITPYYVAGYQPSTLGEKEFGVRLDDVRDYTLHDTSLTTWNDEFGGEDTDDEIRLDRQSEYNFPDRREACSSEGDVQRIWDNHIATQVKTAYDFPWVEERTQIGPMGSTSYAGTADIRFSTDAVILVGDLKKPGTITDEWLRPRDMSTVKRRLGKELRGYVLVKFNVKFHLTDRKDTPITTLLRIPSVSME
jgi:hypothetical protein